MPLIMIASCGLSPMSIGNTKVAPNIATTCWAPRPTVLGHDSRSSGATTSFGPRVPSCSFQPIDILPPWLASCGVTLWQPMLGNMIPGAASPLTRALLTGPPRETQVLATFPTALYLSAGAHHEVL